MDQVIRVFPSRTKWTPTDDLAVVGDPPLLWESPNLPIRVSVTFTWDIPEGERLAKAWSRYFDDVKIGGPAFDDPGGDFKSGMFVKNSKTTGNSFLGLKGQGFSQAIIEQ